MFLTADNIEELRQKLNLRLIDAIRHIEDALLEGYCSPNSAIQLYSMRNYSKSDKVFLEQYLHEYGWDIVFDDDKNNCVPYIKKTNG